jgi:pyruvate/2-oxoglutarate dehydrogenase complex dihydrolipoamide acyltransferase (E2) component
MRRCSGLLTVVCLVIAAPADAQNVAETGRPPSAVLNDCRAKAVETHKQETGSSYVYANAMLGYGITYINCVNNAGYEYSYVSDPMPVIDRLPDGKWSFADGKASSAKSEPAKNQPASKPAPAVPKATSETTPARQPTARPAARREASDDRCANFRRCASDTPRAANMSITTSPSIFAKCGVPPPAC